VVSGLSSSDDAHSDLHTLSLHDALPIWLGRLRLRRRGARRHVRRRRRPAHPVAVDVERGDLAERRLEQRVRRAVGLDLVDARLRSEEHTSELQSPYDLVCRLLLEKKKTK